MSNYDKQLNIKLSTREQTALASASTKHNISKSQLIRSAIVNLDNNADKIVIRDKRFKDDLIYEHRKIGNNINQIAYSLNYVLKAGLHNQLEGTILDTEQKLENIQNQLNMLEAYIEKRL